MKRIYISAFIIFIVSTLNAQTKVVKMSATKSTDYGVTYFLPKTVLTIRVEYSKTTQKAGTFARYAERYLGVKEQAIVPEDKVYYTLNKINVTSKGVVDRNEAYLVDFKAKTTSPFVYLTEDGLICTINADYVPEPVKNDKVTVAQPAQKSSSPPAHSFYSEEFLNAGSDFKMAEVAAKRIFKLRESRTDIHTGEAENAPRDGEGLKIVLANSEAEEKALLELFTGTTSVESFDAEFELEPLSDIDKEILFRFSKYSGIVEPEDLSGNPVYINVKNLDNTEKREIIDPKRKTKEIQSIIYNNPGRATVEVIYGNNSMFKNTFQIVQFGSKQVLAPSMFDDKKGAVKVYFFPETGGIKQITQ